MDDIQRYSYLWDGSQPGWTLVRMSRQEVSLALLFVCGEPTLAEVKAVRSVVPAYKGQPTGNVLKSLKGVPRLELGTFGVREGNSLSALCREHGLVVEECFHDRTSYLPVNDITNRILAIEDNMINKAVQEEALRRGVPVKTIEP